MLDIANVPGNILAINKPAQVGHPVNNPVIAAMLKNHFVFLFGLLLIANEINIILIPTKIETKSRIKNVNGINISPTCSVI